jgi:histidyl-tRNA synthetase
LFEQLGGKPTPACGFAIGIERMILLLQESAALAPSVPDAYVVHVGEGAARLARAAAEALRDAGLKVVVNAGGGSFKAQMRRASANRVGVKPLRVAGEQVALPPEAVAKHMGLN